METANHIADSVKGPDQNGAGPHVTKLAVGGSGGGDAAITVDTTGETTWAGLTSEVITTPTDAAAAAGDITVEIDRQGEASKADLSQSGVEVTKVEHHIEETTVTIADKAEVETMGSGHSRQAEMVTMTSMKPVGTPDTVTMKSEQAGLKKEIDALLPATSLMSTDAEGTVRLRMTDTGDAALKPTTIPSVLKKTVSRGPGNTALAVKRGGVWKKWTYQQYLDDTRQAAKAFIQIGLEPHHGLGILGFNAPEWFISFTAGIFAGGMSTGIYTTNSPEACHYVLSDCKASIVIVENNVQLQKIIKIWDRLPHLKAVVQYTGEVAERRPDVFSWEEMMAKGKNVPDEVLDSRLSLQAPNTCCSLIYTSGTTGNPKAVMISHDNLTWTADRTGTRLKMQFGREVFVTFLPLSHIAAQMLDIIMPLRLGSAVYFAQPDALKGTLGDTWREVRPTGVLAVPRVWEKIMEKMIATGKQAPALKKKLVLWAKGKGLKGMYAKNNGESPPFGWGIANALVFKKVKVILGLDRCRLFGSGAAPITKETLDFFASLNIRLDEVYGMSESSGPHTFCVDEACRLASVGKELLGVQTKIDNPDIDGNGEICFYGRHVFMGYLNQPEKTREAIDDAGWLHSGDVGKKDKDGFLYITGRIKELIITAGGENVAPVPIEDNVKEVLPCVSNCMLIGDKRKFLSMLITLKTEVNIDTMEPQDKLLDTTLEWCRGIGSSVITVDEAIGDPTVLKAIQAGIDQANKRAVSNAQRVQKWSILPKDFSLPGGELGPTLKLRRPIVVKKYENTIAAFYEEQ